MILCLNLVKINNLGKISGNVCARAAPPPESLPGRLVKNLIKIVNLAGAWDFKPYACCCFVKGHQTRAGAAFQLFYWDCLFRGGQQHPSGSSFSQETAKTLRIQCTEAMGHF